MISRDSDPFTENHESIQKKKKKTAVGIYSYTVQSTLVLKMLTLFSHENSFSIFILYFLNLGISKSSPWDHIA